MKKIIKLALFLGIVCTIAASALMLANNVTAPLIKENQIKETNKSLKLIYPSAQEFKEHQVNEKHIIAYYDVLIDSKKVATIYQVSTEGFQSTINFLIAIDTNGNYQGFEVVSHAETNGYGSQITTDQAYIKQFKDQAITNEIDTIAGSSITTNALKTAIEDVLVHYNKQ